MFEDVGEAVDFAIGYRTLAAPVIAAISSASAITPTSSFFHK
jgi:hypothetical protein